HPISARTTLAVLLALTSFALLCALPFVGSRAQLPSNVITFSVTFDTAHAYGAGCTTFSGPFVVPAGQARIIVNVNATVPTNDFADQLWSLHRRVPGPQRGRALNRRKLENRSH